MDDIFPTGTQLIPPPLCHRVGSSLLDTVIYVRLGAGQNRILRDQAGRILRAWISTTNHGVWSVRCGVGEETVRCAVPTDDGLICRHILEGAWFTEREAELCHTTWKVISWEREMIGQPDMVKWFLK